MSEEAKDAYLACIKRWPALYAVMTLVMDDVVVDEEKAKEKWGDAVVRLAESRYDSAIHADDARKLFIDLVLHLNLPSIVDKPAEAAKDAPTSAAPPKPASSGPPRGGPRRSGGGGVSKWFEGEVTEVDKEEKLERYGGGFRDVMVIKLSSGRQVKGTIPSAMVGKVQVGDHVKLRGQVTVLDERLGWFKYPANMTILESAK